VLIDYFSRETDDVTWLVTALRAHGFRVVPLRADNPKALAYRDYGNRTYLEIHWRGVRVGIWLGHQPDGSYLILIDIDGHTAQQNPEAILATIRAWVGEDAFAKCLLKRSTSGTGYHILIRAPEPLPHNRRFYVNHQHGGEVLCDGGHFALIGEVLQGDLAALPLLTPEEWAAWRAAITIQHGTRNPTSWTAMVREIWPMIRGAEHLDIHRFRCPDGMPKAFQGTARRHQIALAVWRRLKHARKGERSAAYSNYLQSLMLLAPDAYGATLEERCRTIAAIAMEDCPKRDEPNYSVQKDTAALIGRILHGDARSDGSGSFRIPHWAREYTPPGRHRGRPKGGVAAQLEALRRFLLRHAVGDQVDTVMTRHGPRKLTVTIIAAQLDVSVRTAQRYLHQLRANREILSDVVEGRHGHLIVYFLSRFNHVLESDMERQ